VAWTTVSRERRPVRGALSPAGGRTPVVDAHAPPAPVDTSAVVETSAALETAAVVETSAPVETSASAWRRPAALLLALAFGCQAFGYYGVTAWLPTLLADERGLSRAAAGVSSSLFQIMGIIGAVVVPLVIRSGLGHRGVMLGICTSWIVLPLGLVVAPALWWLWCCFGGFAQGGGFTIIFTIVLRQARGIVDRQRLSTLVQGLGYAIGACGPTVVGAVHQATGSWDAPMLVVAFGLVVMAVAGTTAATLSPPVPAAV
jgi:CP family cyanate transporter-like MFS transporter